MAMQQQGVGCARSSKGPVMCIGKGSHVFVSVSSKIFGVLLDGTWTVSPAPTRVLGALGFWMPATGPGVSS
jgi:hypothetical protein